jgi:hypothetical protein
MVLLLLIKLGLSKIFNRMASWQGCVPKPLLTRLAATEAVDETKILGLGMEAVPASEKMQQFAGVRRMDRDDQGGAARGEEEENIY